MVIKKYKNQKERGSFYQRVIYRGVKMLRYKAVWLENKGSIPKGFQIHHINGIKWDDRIENLECLSRKVHGLRHRAINKKTRTTKNIFKTN